MDGESNATFPAADAEGSLDPSRGNDVRVDPISAEVADLKEQAEVAEMIKGEEDKCTCDGLKTLKRAVIISAVVVAVGGAALVIARKLKEK